MDMEITVYGEGEGEDENGETEETHRLPARMTVCPRCEGHGSHLTPSIGQHAYSQEEFNEAFAEEEEREAYFKRGGMYDVTCEECRGKRVVAVPDEARIAQDPTLAAIYARWQEQQRDAARSEAEDAYTYRMESGGYG